MRYEKLEVAHGAFIGNSFRGNMERRSASQGEEMARPFDRFRYLGTKSVPVGFAGGEFVIGKSRRAATTGEAIAVIKGMEKTSAGINIMAFVAEAFEPSGPVTRDLNAEKATADFMISRAKTSVAEKLKDLEALAKGKTKEFYQRQREFLEGLGHS